MYIGTKPPGHARWLIDVYMLLKLPTKGARKGKFTNFSGRMPLSDSHPEVLQEQGGRAGLFALLQQAPVPIAIVRGDDLVFEFANPAYHQMVSREHLINRKYGEVFPEALRDKADVRMRAVMREAKPFFIPEVCRSYDRLGDGVQEDRYFSLSYTPLKDPGGEVSALIISAVDLTDQVRARTALQDAIDSRERALQLLSDSERRVQGIVNSAPTTIFTLTPDGKLSFTSQSFTVFTGSTSESLLGESWQFTNIVHPDDLPSVMAMRENSFATYSPLDMQIRLRRADGAYRWHLTRMVPSFNEEGGLIEWIGTSTDIEDQKRIEAELSRNQDDLEKALQAKDEFLSLVSHELRSPLTVIMGYSRMLSRVDASVAQEQQDWAKDIFAQSRRLEAIIENLLSMARYADESIVDLEVLLLARIINQITTEMLIGSERAIVVEIEGEVAPALGNAFCIEQILRNLISNALKYSPSHTPVRVTCRSTPEAVLVCVSDQGPGIASDEAQSIFEPFYRSSKTSSSPGVGIGLTVCTRLAAAMGARVELTKTSSEGTTFTLSVPLAQSQ